LTASEPIHIFLFEDIFMEYPSNQEGEVDDSDACNKNEKLFLVDGVE
jgi:hypothetical protein